MLHREVQVLEGLPGAVCSNTRPALHRTRGTEFEGCVGLGDLLRTDLYHLLAHAVVHTVPFAGGPRREDHVGAITLLQEVADQRTLLILDEAAGVVEHSNRGDRKPRARPRFLHGTQDRPPLETVSA